MVRSIYLSPLARQHLARSGLTRHPTSLTACANQPEQQAPPVQRMRVRYAKRGRLRFTSHRDFSRAFERALVRARIPMAYSSGFNPHPRISYAGASPTGAASEAEYLEIGLAERGRRRQSRRRSRRGAARRPRRR